MTGRKEFTISAALPEHFLVFLLGGRVQFVLLYELTLWGGAGEGQQKPRDVCMLMWHLPPTLSWLLMFPDCEMGGDSAVWLLFLE